MACIDRQRALLAAAGRLYERYQAASQPIPFNIFTVLRKASDEVHLHSRFLHALLDHRDQETGERENLRDFIDSVAGVPEISLDGARVAREKNHIDLLIEGKNEAVVIENKIYARDQEQQLLRYHDALVSSGAYDDSAVHLCYLTLFGTEPEAQSTGSLRERVTLLSYRDNLPKWLRSCQRRAFDEPFLRDSIAQYIELVRRLTGTDQNGTYMNKLKALLMRDDNMVVARGLVQAYTETHIDLVHLLWCEDANTIGDRIPDLHRDPDYVRNASRDDVRKTVAGLQHFQSGLHYRVADGIWIVIAATTNLWYGIHCDEEDFPREHQLLKALCAHLGGFPDCDNTSPGYVWHEPALNLRTPTEETLAILNSADRRNALADTITKELTPLWTKLKDDGFHDPNTG